MIKKITKNIIIWIVNTSIFLYPRKLMRPVINFALNSKDSAIVFYNDPKRSQVFEKIRNIKNENEMVLEYNEAYQLFMAVKRTKKIKGDIAEVGVYKGGSAKLICEAMEYKTLHLFDTFQGLPDLSNQDDSNQFQKGFFSASLDEVKKYLKNYKNVCFYQGLFPSTAEPIKNTKFSFVHLDVDLYQSTLESVKFFYPRMSKGGIIISHDYINIPGVRKAVDEFFEDKPEPVIEMSGSQCLIVKL